MLLHRRQQTLHVQSPDGSTFLCEMTSWLPSWNYDVVSEIQLNQSMCIYLKNSPAKFHPDPIRNDGALGFFWRGRPNKKNKSSDVRSVPGIKINRSTGSILTTLQQTIGSSCPKTSLTHFLTFLQDNIRLTLDNNVWKLHHQVTRMWIFLQQ